MLMMFAVCLVLAAEETAGANDIEQLLQNRFEPGLRKTMQEHHIPGVAVAVVKGGKLAYARGFGVRNVDSGEAVSTRSLFHMASVTKTFVATAVMQLWEQGKISLDAPVVSYLPYFRLDDARYKDITIARMLNHTSGMPDVMNYEWDRPAYDDGALEEYVRSLSSRKLIGAPGDQQRYSNMAYLECAGHEPLGASEPEQRRTRRCTHSQGVHLRRHVGPERQSVSTHRH